MPSGTYRRDGEEVAKTQRLRLSPESGYVPSPRLSRKTVYSLQGSTNPFERLRRKPFLFSAQKICKWCPPVGETVPLVGKIEPPTVGQTLAPFLISVHSPTGVSDFDSVMRYISSRITDRKYIPNDVNGSPNEQDFRHTSTFAKTGENTKFKAGLGQ
ncbi:hypothetical protein AVEN_241458-1 [Araneus ventricosus]|uniref:Uncharacterized protein n=1 Tax=Araneus ventricosus TaxID=182803 RepID=A0A4Y2NEM6_ARAVE|nr:hypothetical protein AVEN_241458-1 [Araneus ventricosus]